MYMIYTILLKSNLLQNSKYEIGLVYLFGSLFYLIVHALLFSRLFDNVSHVTYIRWFVYTLFAFDMIMFNVSLKKPVIIENLDEFKKEDHDDNMSLATIRTYYPDIPTYESKQK